MDRRDGLDSIFSEEALCLKPSRMSLTEGMANWRLIVAFVVVGNLRIDCCRYRLSESVVGSAVGSGLRNGSEWNGMERIGMERIGMERNGTEWNDVVAVVVGSEL